MDFQELQDYFVIIYDKMPSRFTHIISKNTGKEKRIDFRNNSDVLGTATPFFEADGLMVAALMPSMFLKRYNGADLEDLPKDKRRIYDELANGTDISDNPILLFLRPKIDE